MTVANIMNVFNATGIYALGNGEDSKFYVMHIFATIQKNWEKSFVIFFAILCT